MIQFSILLPLVAVGIASALWREYKHSKNHQALLQSLPQDTNKNLQEIDNKQLYSTKAFDDVGELNHYQQISWYSFAFALSGRWFYAPIALLSLPLLSYNAYNFIKTFRQSNLKEQKSPKSVFEILSFSASFMLGNFAIASTILLFSFGFRKLLLRAGNITNSGLLSNFNLKTMNTWVLRDGVETELSISALQEGDIVVVHTDEIILITGKIFQGIGVVSQYSLKKCMKEIPKKRGDYVYPFTRLISGTLYIRYSLYS